MTVGDVNATAWMIGATGVTLWAAIVGTSVLFKNKAKRAAQAAEQETKKVAAIGAGITVIAGLFAIVLVSQPNGLFKLIGMVLLACLLLLAILGSAGLATLTGERLCGMNRRLSQLGGVGRGAALLIVAGFMPVIGWALLFPAMLMLSMGAGWIAMRMKTIAEPTSAAIPSSAAG